MDSNHRPAVYETAALPLSYAGTEAKSQSIKPVILAIGVNLALIYRSTSVFTYG